MEPWVFRPGDDPVHHRTHAPDRHRAPGSEDPGLHSDVALIDIGLAQYDEAFRALNQAADARSGMLVYAKVDPKLNPLRSDPRFAQLLSAMHLPASR